MSRSDDFQVRSMSIGMQIHHVKMMKWASPANRARIDHTAETRTS